MHRFDLLSLFPEFFQSPLQVSLLKKGQEEGLLDIRLVDIRDYSQDRHRRVDDRPYGGGPGMVMMAEPVLSAIRDVRQPSSYVVYMSPQGAPLTAKTARRLAQMEHLVILCGHYEGIDERVMKEVDEEISIGDYVLTNGCLAACVLLDATARFIPGVIGHEEAANCDSFEGNRLDCPHYTRPEVFEGDRVPEVLLKGDHKKIAEWRQLAAEEKTRLVRPDLLQQKILR